MTNPVAHPAPAWYDHSKWSLDATRHIAMPYTRSRQHIKFSRRTTKSGHNPDRRPLVGAALERCL
jgi:hypothetical protein